MLKVAIVIGLYGENMYMGQKRRVLSLICIVSLLASLVFTGCNDAPSESEIREILAKSDPIIKEVLSSAYGFTSGKDYLSEGFVGHSRMAEYEFEIKGIKYKASVDTYPSEPVTYTNYYQKEFEELFKGKILGGIDDLDLFSGCEYEVDFFSFWDSTPGEHNPRYSGGGMKLPTFVTPDNLSEYIASSDVLPLNINMIINYFGPSDVKVSEEKVRMIWKDFYPLHYGSMRIKHYETGSLIDFKNLLAEYYYYPDISAWNQIEYAYLDLTDGVIVRCPAGKEANFEYYVNGNTLHVKAPSTYEYLMHISRDRLAKGDKYYEFYTDPDGKKKRTTQTWYGNSYVNDWYVNGEYSLPLR